MADQLWTKILSSLQEEVNPQIFNTWFSTLSPVSLADRKLQLEAPHPFIKDWIEENYLVSLNRAASAIFGQEVSVAIDINEQGGAAPPAAAAAGLGTRKDNSNAQPPLPAPATPDTEPVASNLNPKYTFESFVVGSSNQFAHAATMAVAEQPARSYNPLFIYGGVGLGKTHLMHAIGNLALGRNPGIRMCYLSSERFMNELINSIRFDRMHQFREKYRNMDILLVDDIQFIAGKERTQEEFFHTFNTLFDSHKQIVVSSDKFPREISDLEERLRSRFEWGLIADIQAPDLETKVAILNKKAEISGVVLPSDVALFLAENTGSNIRELEGYLQRVTAFAAFARTKVITIKLVQDALKNFLEQQKRIITVEIVQKKVSSFYGVKVSDLKSKKKNKAFILPRHSAMYLVRKLTDLSLPEIGRNFGGRDHTTVLHAVQKMEKQVETDRDLASTMQQITRELENNHG